MSFSCLTSCQLDLPYGNEHGSAAAERLKPLGANLQRSRGLWTDKKATDTYCWKVFWNKDQEKSPLESQKQTFSSKKQHFLTTENIINPLSTTPNFVLCQDHLWLAVQVTSWTLLKCTILIGSIISQGLTAAAALLQHGWTTALQQQLGPRAHF